MLGNKLQRYNPNYTAIEEIFLKNKLNPLEYYQRKHLLWVSKFGSTFQLHPELPLKLKSPGILWLAIILVHKYARLGSTSV